MMHKVAGMSFNENLKKSKKYKYLIITYSGEDIVNKKLCFWINHTYKHMIMMFQLTLGSNQALIILVIMNNDDQQNHSLEKKWVVF